MDVPPSKRADKPETVVIIPALNEEHSIGEVVTALPGRWIDEVIVVDKRSSDATSTVARQSGAFVTVERRQGYGSACLTGLVQLPGSARTIVFQDGDYSDLGPFRAITRESLQKLRMRDRDYGRTVEMQVKAL
jgi:glycosyltransferase involved in cell wall biosynthesis